MVQVPVALEHLVEEGYDQTYDEDQDPRNPNKRHELELLYFLNYSKPNLQNSQDTNNEPWLDIELLFGLWRHLPQNPVQRRLENNQFSNTNAQVIDHDHKRRRGFGHLGVEKMAHYWGIVAMAGEVFGFQQHDWGKLVDCYGQNVYEKPKNVPEFGHDAG